jgi:hypothetical protein
MNALGALKLKIVENYKHLAFILGLLIISWWGGLDALANRVNGDSINDAVVIYGIARSINAAVSLLQSAEVGAIIGSINPGEVFDPVNDLIERFSTVMTWSLSSLALQKILLSILSSYSVKILFTIACLFLIYTKLFLQQNKYLKRAWTVFIFIAATRFSVGIACAVTAAADSGFVKSIERQSVSAISNFNTSISLGVQEIGVADGELEEIASDLAARENELREQIEGERDELANLKRRLSNAPDRSFWEFITRRKKSDEVVALEDDIAQTEMRIEALDNLREELEAQIECNDARREGESCDSGFSKFRSMFSAAKIGETSNLLAETIDDLITVLVSMVLTTIIFPLAFLYIAIRLFKVLSMSLLNDFDTHRLATSQKK